MSLLVYVDRGVISSAAVSGSPRVGAGDPGSGLQGEFGVGYALFGLLQAAFMLGLLIGAPAFSAAAKTWNPFKLIGLGLAGWTLAAAGCATATTYAAFFACRVFVGLGEASFCALAAPFIDDVAPPGRKTLWLAMFYLCIPLGVAGGVMFGGAVAGAPESAHALGWRWAFGLEAVAMAPVALFCLASGPVPMRGVDERAARLRSGGGETRRDAEAADDLATTSRRKLCWRTTFRSERVWFHTQL
jgi:MFS family permease